MILTSTFVLLSLELSSVRAKETLSDETPISTELPQIRRLSILAIFKKNPENPDSRVW